VSERDPYSRVEYRRLIAWPERIRREWPLLEEVLSSGPSRRVLELGCGPGEHARALADGGFEVVGVDRSEAMIADATAEPVPSNLTFLRGDITEVDRLVAGRFGAALCLGNTLPHLTEEGELARFASALARVLHPGAPLLLQVLNYDRILDQGLRFLPLSFRPQEDGELVFLRLMEPLPDGRVRFFPSTLLLRPGEEPPLVLERSREVLLRGWRRRELEGALAAEGILAERTLGGFDGAPFDAERSPDLLLVARAGGASASR
jgi:glycine/sarcosine N-methyltransferase